MTTSARRTDPTLCRRACLTRRTTDCCRRACPTLSLRENQAVLTLKLAPAFKLDPPRASGLEAQLGTKRKQHVATVHILKEHRWKRPPAKSTL